MTTPFQPFKLEPIPEESDGTDYAMIHTTTTTLSHCHKTTDNFRIFVDTVPLNASSSKPQSATSTVPSTEPTVVCDNTTDHPVSSSYDASSLNQSFETQFNVMNQYQQAGSHGYWQRQATKTGHHLIVYGGHVLAQEPSFSEALMRINRDFEFLACTIISPTI